MVYLATILQKLLWEQVFLQILTPNDLEGKGQITPQTIPTENLPRYTFKPNLVILGQFFKRYADKQCLTDGQTDKQSDGQTGDDNTISAEEAEG